MNTKGNVVDFSFYKEQMNNDKPVVPKQEPQKENGYIVRRYHFKHGNERDPVEITYSKEKETFQKAYVYGKRYAKGKYFCAFEICDAKTMRTLYRETAEGLVEDFR